MTHLKNKKKASAEIGIAIIAMAVLLILGGIFVDGDNTNTKNNYFSDKYNNNNNNNNNYPEETYLFYLNKTELGRQSKTTETFPNIELGSKVEHNIIYLGNNFKLKANPLTNNEYSFTVNLENPENINSFLLYFNPERTLGEQDLIIKVENKTYYKGTAKNNEIPILINKQLDNQTSNIKITFELEKPKWYQIFNWNTLEISNLKVVEKKQKKDNNIKEFSFQIEKDFLERVELNMVFDCKKTTSNEAIKVSLNDYTLADFNPDCTSYTKIIEKEIPINILSNTKNDIKFETTGFYSLAYSLNKIYYNDQQTYKFTISNFNDIIDVVMYGDFDKEIIDIKINQKTISLKRDEIKSIIAYLKYGTNEIEFLNKPLEIKEFVIEKSEFIY